MQMITGKAKMAKEQPSNLHDLGLVKCKDRYARQNVIGFAKEHFSAKLATKVAVVRISTQEPGLSPLNEEFVYMGGKLLEYRNLDVKA